MEGSIAYNDLGALILFLLLLGAGGYFIMTLIKANLLIRNVSGMLETNRDRLNKTADNLYMITENTVDISEATKKSMDKVSKVIDVISEDTAETILTINKTANELGTYALVIGEIVKVVVNLFNPDRK